MKPETIASHRALIYVVLGLFEGLLVISTVICWSEDPRRYSSLHDAAGTAALFSVLGLFGLWWLLRHGSPRLAWICLISGLVGIGCGTLLPAIP